MWECQSKQKSLYSLTEDISRRGQTNIHNFGTMTKNTLSWDAMTPPAAVGAYKAEPADDLAVGWVCTGEGILGPNCTGL